MEKVLLVILCAGNLLAQGLSLNYADVILSGMKPGMVYSLKKEKGLPYGITNHSAEKTDIEVSVEKPIKGQLKPGYEAIPDVSWVSVSPAKFSLEPKESIECDAIISIPSDKKYANRQYQAMIVAKTATKPWQKGVAIAFALASRLRFSTGPRPEQFASEYRKKIFEALKIELSPLSFFLSKVPIGKKVKLGSEEFSTLQIVNKGRKNYKVEFSLAGNPRNYGLTKDYEPLPKEIRVKFKKKKMKTKKRSISDVVMELKIPDKEEFYDKSFAFVVVGRILGFDIPIELFSRVYFKTQEKKK